MPFFVISMFSARIPIFIVIVLHDFCNDNANVSRTSLLLTVYKEAACQSNYLALGAVSRVDYVMHSLCRIWKNTDYAPAPLIVFSDVATIRKLNSSL